MGGSGAFADDVGVVSLAACGFARRNARCVDMTRGGHEEVVEKVFYDHFIFDDQCDTHRRAACFGAWGALMFCRETWGRCDRYRRADALIHWAEWDLIDRPETKVDPSSDPTRLLSQSDDVLQLVFREAVLLIQTAASQVRNKEYRK